MFQRINNKVLITHWNVTNYKKTFSSINVTINHLILQKCYCNERLRIYNVQHWMFDLSYNRSVIVVFVLIHQCKANTLS